MKSREEIAEVLRGVKDLPTLPDVAIRLLEMSENPDVSTQELGRVIERDPVIATKLLRLINSSYYGIGREVTSVQQALLLLGLSNLRNLVLSSSIMNLFDHQGFVGSFSRQEFWRHSVATAVVAHTIARRQRKMDPEIAFTAGLIHDVGKVVIDRYFHEQFVKIIEALDKYNVTMSAAETAVLGADHAEVGYFIADRWRLPDVLKLAVSFHHEPRLAGEFSYVAALVSLADGVARKLKLGSGGGADPDLSDDLFELCQLDAQLFRAIQNEIVDNIDEQIGELTRSL